MKKVKQQMVIQLLKSLHNANMADSTREFDGGQFNDLDGNLSRQDSLYGHISNALASLGPLANQAKDIYCETGDIDEAIAHAKIRQELSKRLMIIRLRYISNQTNKH